MSTSRDQKVVDGYARKFGVTIDWSVKLTDIGNAGPRANREARRIWAVPLDQSPASFWTAMHELGHIAHGHERAFFAVMGFGDPYEPEQEAEAWVWAIDHAGRPLDAAGKADIQFALSSYLNQNEQSAVIGPNLKRLFTAIGPDVDTAVMEKQELGPDRVHIPDAKRIWSSFASKYADDNDLAAAA